MKKVKTWIIAWFLCIWIWFCWIVRQKCLLIFGQTLLILAKVCSSCSAHLLKSRVVLDWGIRTLKKSANFKLFKDFQFYSRSSYFSSLASQVIPTVQKFYCITTFWFQICIICVRNTKLNSTANIYSMVFMAQWKIVCWIVFEIYCMT